MNKKLPRVQKKKPSAHQHLSLAVVQSGSSAALPLLLASAGPQSVLLSVCVSPLPRPRLLLSLLPLYFCPLSLTSPRPAAALLVFHLSIFLPPLSLPSSSRRLQGSVSLLQFILPQQTTSCSYSLTRYDDLCKLHTNTLADTSPTPPPPHYLVSTFHNPTVCLLLRI